MTAAYYLIAGATMERLRAELMAASWPAPPWVLYVVAALGGLSWPVVVMAWLIGRVR